MQKNLNTEIEKTETSVGTLLEEISHFIFEHPELGGEEEESCAYLTDVMRGQGFRVTCPYAGERTGFRAEFGGGDGPVVAFLAEYDALPGFGKDNGPAHACGHNWIAAVTAGAAIVTSRLLKDVPGRVVLIGTPAEESYGGKINMISRGGFADVDVAMQAHLDAATETAPTALAMTSTRFGFKGKAAHAAQAPHEGINALDAAQLTFSGINAMRQHLTPDVRVHGIITDGGTAPNVVPEHSGCEFYVRAASRSTAEAVTEKLFNCVKGAALMTGAEWYVERQDAPFYDLVAIPALTELADRRLTENGFASLHRSADQAPGSSDIGNVSYVCPTLYMEISPDERTSFPVHDRAALDCADSETAYRRLHQVARALSGVALDLFACPELLAKVKQEHAQIIGGGR